MYKSRDLLALSSTIEKFRLGLIEEIENNRDKFENDEKYWVVKGFIDECQNIYSISCDTKVVSKIIELNLFPIAKKYAYDNDFKIELAAHQNYYPDLSFINNKTKEKIAVDIKTTYRIGDNKVNGFTLGAYSGYFINRNIAKNITYPYKDYNCHLVLGVIYTHNTIIDEMKVFKLSDIDKIPWIAKDFSFLLQEKYKLSSMTPGSGNTKNIGSIKEIDKLINGEGPFAILGEEEFDKHWKNKYYASSKSGLNEL